MVATRSPVGRLRFSICVSGAAAGPTVKESAQKAYDIGVAIAKSGHILTTGATVGLPYQSALGSRDAGGLNIGFSPASSLREHLRKYRLPSGCFDFINFTGMNYVGRDLYLVQSSDAVITVGGRFGSLHEFTSAIEAHKPCGVLLGSGGTADEIPGLIKALGQPRGDTIIFDDDPARLVKRIVDLLDKQDGDIRKDVGKDDPDWLIERQSRTTKH